MAITKTDIRHYPSRQKAGALHDDLRLLFDHMYKQQRENRELRDRIEELHKRSAGGGGNGPSTTKIQGLNVKAVPPTNGQVLTYNAATGEIEWQ